jgi:hypothetical protein
VRAGRCVPEDLVAQRDRVVREPVLRVQVRGALVHVHRLGHLLELEVDVPDAIEQRQLVGEFRCALESLEQLEVLLDGAVELALVLEPLGLELELLDVQG